MPRDSLTEFTDAYIVAALWSSLDDDGNPLGDRFDSDDIDSETLAAMRADCRAFYIANETHILCDGGPSIATASQVEVAGHDFWLTRCGHGAGFWDGDWPEPHATALDSASKAFGDVDLYVGDDYKIYS